MTMQVRNLVGALVVGTAVLFTPLATVSAAPEAQRQSGLVNVNVGPTSVLNNANVGVAAQVAAEVCGVSVGPIAALAQQVARTGATQTVCNSAQGPVTISRA